MSKMFEFDGPDGLAGVRSHLVVSIYKDNKKARVEYRSGDKVDSLLSTEPTLALLTRYKKIMKEQDYE